MLKRELTQRLVSIFKQFPAIAILGPRQSGKTINTDYFKNIKYFNMISNMNNHSYLIYNGKEESRSDAKIFNWQNLDLLWSDIQSAS
jgi:predicted AAA+ superfamily ATPase